MSDPVRDAPVATRGIAVGPRLFVRESSALQVCLLLLLQILPQDRYQLPGWYSRSMCPSRSARKDRQTGGQAGARALGGSGGSAQALNAPCSGPLEPPPPDMLT